MTLIEQHPTDVCATIADAVLAPLATLVLNQEARNGEAVEAAMKLFEALFHGSPQSQKYVTQAFFLKTAPTRPTEDERRLEASAQCLKMLSNPLEALTAAKTFNTQLSLLDVYASLGGRASSFIISFLKPHLPKGVTCLKHAGDASFTKHATATLQRLNDFYKTKSANRGSGGSGGRSGSSERQQRAAELERPC